MLVQHDVTVDHTMLSGVAKLSNLQCSTMCDNVCWTMLKEYVKLTYICWTTIQIYVVIIFSFGRMAQLVAHSLRKREVPGSSLGQGTWQGSSSLLACDDILLACDFCTSFHSLKLLFRIVVNKTSLVLLTLIFAYSWSSISLSPLLYQLHSNFQQVAAMFKASWVQLRLELLVCDRSVSLNVITHTSVGLKCLTETKIQILRDHVDHTHFHIVEIGCQLVQLLSAHIIGPTMFINLTPA